MVLPSVHSPISCIRSLSKSLRLEDFKCFIEHYKIARGRSCYSRENFKHNTVYYIVLCNSFQNLPNFAKNVITIKIQMQYLKLFLYKINPPKAVIFDILTIKFKTCFSTSFNAHC